MKGPITTATRTVSLLNSTLKSGFFHSKTQWDKYNQLATGLFIGQIPLGSSWIGGALIDKIVRFVNGANPYRPLRRIISVLEPDEAKGEGFLCVNTVTASDLAERKIERTLLNVPDFTAGFDEKATIDAVFDIRKCIVENGSAYVHCKAGRARSATVCLLYLMYFEINPYTQKRYTLSEALSHLTSCRVQIDLSQAKIDKARKIFKLMERTPEYEAKAMQLAAEEKENPIVKLVTSIQLKADILSLPSVKKLMEYAGEINQSSRGRVSCKRFNYIHSFIKSIANAHCEQWYFTLESKEGPLEKLLQARPRYFTNKSVVEDQGKRIALIDNVRKEVAKTIERALLVDNQVNVNLSRSMS
jgi:hypothetical protein